MIKGRFAQIMNDMRGLIDERSAPSITPAPGSGKLLLAVSGGIDSMCMAELFLTVADSFPFEIAHCNFNLRGEESDGDSAMVREWALNHGVGFNYASFDTDAYASEHGISIEMAARELRYGWFAGLCIEKGYRAVAVAHNANDNAETLILNLLRGAGIHGIGGMKPVADFPCDLPLLSKQLQQPFIIRPLLGFTRKQIEGYVFAHRINYREDSTNSSSDYKRNCIRNEVFPIFEKLNPSFIRTFNREMAYFSETSEIVDEWSTKAQEKVVISHDDKSSMVMEVSLTELLKNPHWRYLLYHILEPYGFTSSVLLSVEDLISSDRTVSGKRFESITHALITGRGVLKVCPLGNVPVFDQGMSTSSSPIMTVRCAGTYHFNGTAVKVELSEWSSDMPFKQPEGTLIMDADRFRFPFVLRTWRKGDWFVPFGMKGKKKVSDLFADLKYDSFMKSGAVIMVDTMSEGLSEAGHVAGVAGVRIDDRYKVTSATSTVIRLTII